MRLFIVVLAVALAAVLSPASAGADPPQRVTIDISETFVDPFLSETCGFDVVISISGEVNVMLVYNDDGLIVREFDRVGGSKLTYSSPDTGASFSFPNIASHWDYGDGATIGSDVTIRFTGLFGHATGAIASDAGLTVFEGEVVGFDEFGIPEVEFGELVLERGNRESGDDIVPAICRALSG